MKPLDRWQALNERQQGYMTVFYRADQAAEAHEKGAWSRGERSRPAAEWRWMDYGPVGNAYGVTGRLQRDLAAHGIRDQGAGATLKVLEQQGLIKTRAAGAILADHALEIQLTPLGRAACRAGGLDPDRPTAPRKGMLSEVLWSMLVDVWQAGMGGHPTYSGGAWERLAGRKPVPLVWAEETTGERFPYRMHLTEAGRKHYAVLWRDYARTYPKVTAPHPDGEQVWPAPIDEELAYLRRRCSTLRDHLKRTRKEIEELTGLAVGPVQMPLAPFSDGQPPGEIKRLLARRDRAAAACQAAAERATRTYQNALNKATGAYQDALDEHLAALQTPYRQACAHYAQAAAAVVQAVADGTDPAAALRVDPAAVTAWPWVPDPPQVGLAEVDSDLQRAHTSATGHPAGKRRRRATAPPAPDVLREGERLIAFADTLADLVKDGRLVRLLLRRT